MKYKVAQIPSVGMMVIEDENGILISPAEVAGLLNSLEQRLAEAKIPRWIPVSERLPKECHAVLICKDGNETSCGYRLSGDWYEENELLAAYDITVTDWMPLPEPPESRKGER